MAISSYPFENQDTTENQYTELFREFQDDGIADSSNGTGLKVVANGGLTVGVQPGFAIIRGHAIKSTAVENVAVTSSAQEVIHRIILKLDPASNAITIVLKAGTPGAGAPPALTRTEYGIWEFGLATVTVPAGAAGIGNAAIEDTRRFLGHQVSVWGGSAGRPGDPRTGSFGYNTELDRFEFFDGSQWRRINVGWEQVEGKPNTFPPESHQHGWGSIQNKPDAFPPQNHSHSYVVRAGGTDKLHETPNPAGQFAVWVDNNGNFTRENSSERYKDNIRDAEIDPKDVLALKPRKYDRKPVSGEDSAPKDQFGLIAEEVHETLPEIVYRHLGKIDGIHYDKLAVALLAVVQDQQQQIEDLRAYVTKLDYRQRALKRAEGSEA